MTPKKSRKALRLSDRPYYPSCETCRSDTPLAACDECHATSMLDAANRAVQAILHSKDPSRAKPWEATAALLLTGPHLARDGKSIVYYADVNAWVPCPSDPGGGIEFHARYIRGTRVEAIEDALAGILDDFAGSDG